MTSNRIARSYARALLNAATKKGAEAAERSMTGLSGLSQMTKAQPKLLAVMKSPVFTRQEKHKVILELAKEAGLDELTTNFSLLLADKNRFEEIDAIVGNYKELLDVQKGVLRGKLVTAMELTDAQKTAVVEQLEKQMNRQVVLEYSVAPEIIGGVVFEIGDEVLDASIRAQLSILKDTIKRGE